MNKKDLQTMVRVNGMDSQYVDSPRPGLTFGHQGFRWDDYGQLMANAVLAGRMMALCLDLDGATIMYVPLWEGDCVASWMERCLGE